MNILWYYSGFDFLEHNSDKRQPFAERFNVPRRGLRRNQVACWTKTQPMLAGHRKYMPSGKVPSCRFHAANKGIVLKGCLYFLFAVVEIHSEVVFADN